MAAGMSAVYPAPMPGGWLLLGTTEVTMFDPDDEEEPTLLRPGLQVRFVEAVV
jgi:allophanate hydrolase subunit 1